MRMAESDITCLRFGCALGAELIRGWVVVEQTRDPFFMMHQIFTETPSSFTIVNALAHTHPLSMILIIELLNIALFLGQKLPFLKQLILSLL